MDESPSVSFPNKRPDDRPPEVSIRMEDEPAETDRKRKKHRRNSVDEPLRAPKHVHGGDWKDMVHITTAKKSHAGGQRNSTTPKMQGSIRGGSWVEQRLKKRICTKFIASQRYSTRCGCGVAEDQHDAPIVTNTSNNAPSLPVPTADDEATSDGAGTPKPKAPKWTIARNTITRPTDSYGSIQFEGSCHQSRAHYVRTSFDAEPETLCILLEKIWKLPPPKLVITIHGGLTNFDLQPKLARLFRKGILKAARSTDAWIITSGLNAGVVRHVAAALEDLGSSRSRSRVLAIGVAPWGMLKRRQRFEGKDVNVIYTTNQFNKSRLAELNDRHSYFIFADNGTVGRYGAEVILRKRLETFLAQRAAGGRGSGPAVPVVCVALEGGAFTIKVVHDYVTMIPRIPVVVCDGSGRAADLLAFTHRSIGEDGRLPEPVKNQLGSLVESVFNYDKKTAGRILKQLVDCARQKSLLTVFRLGDSQRQDVDHAILKALLKGKNLSPPEQLRLALAWNRADIARSEIFTLGTEWSTSDLHNAMMEALSHDRTDFVQLLLENGVSMHRFLSYGRLENLYNTEHGPPHTLRSHLGLGTKKHNIRLTEVGHAMESLMGNAYKSNYTKEDFKAKYFVFTNRKQLGYQKVVAMNDRQRSENLKETNSTVRLNLLKTARHSIVSIFQGQGSNGKPADDDDLSNGDDDSLDFTFKFPYSELLIWAVLTKRQEMAMLMWRHGEEALAKALVACRLYASLANDASTNFLELEICDELSKHSDEFRQLSIEVLQYCSTQNVDLTLQLLTYELSNWGNETSLSLAALDNNRKFLAHPCSQLLLSDLWHGGLHIRNSSNLKVLGCILMPPSIFLLEFKSKEELKLQPHTAAEHHDENWESDGTISEPSDYSDIDSSDDDEDDQGRPRAPSDNQQPLSFQQLMRERLPFRRDQVAPTSNGHLSSSEPAPQAKSRSRTVSASKQRRRPSRKVEVELAMEVVEEAASKAKRRSTAKHPLANGNGETRKVESSTSFEDEQEIKQSSISWQRKLREFYSAPITTFWLWSLSFYIFLCALIYTLLIETPRKPSWVEWYVFSYTIVWSFEVARKLIMLIMVDNKKKPMLKKGILYFVNYRNGILSFALVMFIASFCIRLNPSTKALGRVLIASNSVLWCLKLIDYLSVHRQIGPYVTMASEMIPRMLPILAMLFVALLSFGLIRQSITYPYEDWHWLLIRNIFYKPYFMLYGEVYAPEIDTCGDEVWDTHIEEGMPISQLNVTGDTCVPGYFVVPLFMTVFMIIANVLLMNTMVACCTYVFERNVEITQEIWLFERYRQVMEYESTPCLPPPFTIIYHIFWIAKFWLVPHHFNRRHHLLDASLKLFLSEDEVERIHSFEEECVEDMEREKDMRKQSSNDQRIHRTAERSELILGRVNQITSFENGLKNEFRDIELKIQSMEYRHKEELEYIRSMNTKLEQLLQLQLANLPAGSIDLIKINKLMAPAPIIDPSGPPAITFDLVESSDDRQRHRGSLRKDQPVTDSEPETETEPSMATPRARHRRNKQYSSIADSIEVDPNLYNDEPRQYSVDPEPFMSEDIDSEVPTRRDGDSGNLRED